MSVLGHPQIHRVHGKLIKVDAFVKRCQTNNALEQDISQPFPECRLPRSCTLGMAPAQRRGINVRERGRKRTPSSLLTKVSPPMSASRTTIAGFGAMSFPHTIHGGIRTRALQRRAAASIPWCGRLRWMESSWLLTAYVCILTSYESVLSMP